MYVETENKTHARTHACARAATQRRAKTKLKKHADAGMEDEVL